MARLRPALLLLATGLISLLSLLSLPAQAADDSSPWCETDNAEFRLISDLGAEDQAALVTALGRFERIAEPFLPGERLSRPSALKLVVFQQRGDFLALTGKRRFAGYMQPSLQTNRLLVGPIRGDLIETTLHEYAHYLLRNRTGVSLPRWFDEGLATLLGHTVLTDDGGRIGDLPVTRLEDRLTRRPQNRTPQQKLNRTLETTVVDRLSGERLNEFYDLSWLLTHYLYFDVYAEELSRSAIPSSGLGGFLSAGDVTLYEHLGVSPSRLLRSLTRHLKRWDGQDPPLIEDRGGEADPEETRFRCLTPLERDLEFARAIHTQNPGKARSLLTPYLTDPGQPPPADLAVALRIVLARAALAEDSQETAQGLVDEALALDPVDAEAMVMSADLTVQGCLFERDDDCLAKWQAASTRYRAALRQDPNRYDGILGMGLARLHSGQPGDAVNYLKVAYTRAPWAAVVNYYLGESYRQVGDSRARIYLENARNWADEDIWRLLAREALRLEAAAPVGPD